MKNLKKYSNLYKVVLKKFVLGCVTSSLAITGVSAFNSIRVESELLNEKKEKIRKEKEDLNNEFESLLSTRDLEISEEASAAINAISLAPLNMTYLEDLDITKDTSILDNNYQMPDVLEREKQEFYQWLWEDKSYEVDLFNSRELVKQR